jgi:NADPH2:quinone reductase
VTPNRQLPSRQQYSPRSTCEKADATQSFASHVLPLVGRGLVRAVLDRTYLIEQVRAADERLESNASFGKIVLTL